MTRKHETRKKSLTRRNKSLTRRKSGGGIRDGIQTFFNLGSKLKKDGVIDHYYEKKEKFHNSNPQIKKDYNNKKIYIETVYNRLKDLYERIELIDQGMDRRNKKYISFQGKIRQNKTWRTIFDEQLTFSQILQDFSKLNKALDILYTYFSKIIEILKLQTIIIIILKKTVLIWMNGIIYSSMTN